MSHLFHHTHTLLYLPSYLAAGLFFVELVCPSMWVFPALRFVRVEDCNEGLRIHSIDKVLPMTICPPQKPLHLSPWILADAKRLHTLFSSGVSEKHD